MTGLVFEHFVYIISKVFPHVPGALLLMTIEFQPLETQMWNCYYGPYFSFTLLYVIRWNAQWSIYAAGLDPI